MCSKWPPNITHCVDYYDSVALFLNHLCIIYTLRIAIINVKYVHYLIQLLAFTFSVNRACTQNWSIASLLMPPLSIRFSFNEDVSMVNFFKYGADADESSSWWLIIIAVIRKKIETMKRFHLQDNFSMTILLTFDNTCIICNT